MGKKRRGPIRNIPSTTKRGEKVLSRAEMRIANKLLQMKIEYIYEKPLSIDDEYMIPDFYLTEYNIYLEYWGLASKKEYARRMRHKMKVYKHNKIDYISVFPKHMMKGQNLYKYIIDEIKKILERRINSP